MVIPGPGPGPEPEPSERNGRFPKIEIVKSISIPVSFPPGETVPVSFPPGETVPVSQVPFVGAFTYDTMATFLKSGAVSDWGDQRFFIQPALNTTYHRMQILFTNPCPVAVVIRLILQSKVGVDLLFTLQDEVIIPAGEGGLYYFDLPYLLTPAIVLYSHDYFMQFFAIEPFETEEGSYLQSPLLFLTSHVTQN